MKLVSIMEATSKTPLEEFIELYSQIKDKFEKLPTVLSKLSNFSDDIVKENADLKTKLKEIDNKFTQLQDEYNTKDSKITDLQKEAENYKSQLQNVEEQMSGLRKMYEEMTQEREQEIDLQELLAIYTILFEKVFAANPHTKILLLLQGVADKEEWTRDELVKTTGFTPAAIIRALHDLRNNGIVETDDSAQKVKLLQKIG
jgi:predicted RNase H-like nuclease (RuvC/YqgF family)